MRICGSYEIHQFPVFSFSKRPKWRTVCSRNADAVSLLKSVSQIVRHPGCTAVEKVPILASRDAAKSLSKLRAIHSPGHGMAMPTAEPNQGHSIRDHKIRRGQNVAELAIATRFRYPVHSGNGDVAARPALRDPAFDMCDDVRNLYGVHANTENLESRGFHRFR